jgi:predicted DNA-binding transcriptional regulator YafY
MNRTDRLLAIILELQTKDWLRAEDLATKFEISKRTIYRDMDALTEIGIPIISSPGQGFALLEGYFLPPVNFTTDEAVVLLLGAEMTAHSFDDDYCQSAHSAATKIRASLPTNIAQAADRLQERLSFVRSDGQSASPVLLRRIRSAVINQRRLRFTYHKRYTQNGDKAVNCREVDPYGLINHEGKWYLVAHCHLRQGLRNFRLERIEDLSTLTQSFDRPDNFLLHEQADDRDVTVRALFDQTVARWVREDPLFFQENAEEKGNDLLVTYRVRHFDEITGWLLSWGARVQVLEPAALRDYLKTEVQAILENY